MTIIFGGGNNPVIDESNVEREQRAAGAFTGIQFKKGAVSPAGQKSTVVVEELVRPPIERCSGMDAIVHIGVIVTTPVHYKTLYNPCTPEDVKFSPSGRA